MQTIFRLSGAYDENCSFIQNYDGFNTLEERLAIEIMGRAMRQRWKAFGDKYSEPVRLKLWRSDTGKKNYKFDISSSLKPFYVFSEQALDKLGDILLPRGEVLPVITDSKRKKYFGYYPTNVFSGCFDKENSIYEQNGNRFLVDKLVLIADKLPPDPLFVIEEDRRVLVTAEFQRRVEEAGLVGFDFGDYNRVKVL